MRSKTPRGQSGGREPALKPYHDSERVDDMIAFRKTSEFPKGTFYNQLVDAYSFNDHCKEAWNDVWMEYDHFLCSNPDIADRYSFITTLDGIPIGHISWDPGNRPDFVEIGHNCIITEYKGNGYGKQQLQEAVRRIKEYKDVKRIVVTTNAFLQAAQKNYESAGFEKIRERINHETPFSGNYIDYEMIIKR